MTGDAANCVSLLQEFLISQTCVMKEDKILRSVCHCGENSKDKIVTKAINILKQRRNNFLIWRGPTAYGILYLQAGTFLPKFGG